MIKTLRRSTSPEVTYIKVLKADTQGDPLFELHGVPTQQILGFLLESDLAQAFGTFLMEFKYRCPIGWGKSKITTKCKLHYVM